MGGWVGLGVRMGLGMTKGLLDLRDRFIKYIYLINGDSWN